MPRQRSATSTSAFGVGRRENHDASDFYARFKAPTVSDDDTVARQPIVDQIVCGDARQMGTLVPRLEPGSVALVVTSPPYFAGKEYEEALGQGHIPGSYLEYLQMLHDVFAACAEALEPGGRIAVNVANLGRKPYRSLAADVVRILEDDLGLLLRGEIVWRKAEGSSGSCAWGSFQSASNPVLRDLTERIVVASKGRFDRARPRPRREREGLPHEDTIFKEDFMSWTTDVWDVPTESATRVGHPAPFPVELPQRLIELYTYRGDLVLDPFMGSGSTAVAAIRTGRYYFGYDTDADYVAAARARADRARADHDAEAARSSTSVVLPSSATPPGTDRRAGEPAGGGDPDDPVADLEQLVARAVDEGLALKEIARAVLEGAGFVAVSDRSRAVAGADVTFTASDRGGRPWRFDVSGALTKGSDRPGLRRTDALWRALGKAAVLRAADAEVVPLVLLTSDLPARGTAGATALQTARDDGLVFDAVEVLRRDGLGRLVQYASGAHEGPIGALYPSTRRTRGG
ncbi:MAG: site-specific DNA-methyltransferase [Acidimicrobiales bacterium]